MTDIVYFLGGPMDLTKRAMDVAARRIQIPVFPARPAATMYAPDAPIELQTSTMTYTLRRIGARTYVARPEGEEDR